MAVRKIRNWWCVDIRHHGKRYRKRCPDNSRVSASAYEVQLRARLARGEPFIPVLQPPEEKKLFLDFSHQWFDTHVRTNNKFSEQRSKRTVLNAHLRPFFGKLELAGITTLKVEQFKAQQQSKGLAAKTINNHLAVLRRALHDAQDWELLETLPKIKALQVAPSKFDFLSPAECRALLSVIDSPRWYAMVLVAMRTGMRLSELLGLRWEDVDLDKRIVVVRRGVVLGHVGSPKNGKQRHIPLTLGVCRALAALPRSAPWVFPGRGDGTSNHKPPYYILHRYCQQAGLRRIGWHTLRHTFASQLVAAGVPLRAVQELLGHSEIRMTMRYTHLAPATLYEAIQVLEEEETATMQKHGRYMGTDSILATGSHLTQHISSEEMALDKSKNRAVTLLLPIHHQTREVGFEPQQLRRQEP